MFDHSDVLKRRQLLRSAGVVTLTVGAGCASFSGPQTTGGQDAKIVITLTNSDDTARDYEVEVIWGANSSSQFSGTLGPSETDAAMRATTGTAPEAATFFIGTTESDKQGEWNPTDCPDYRVDGVIENGTISFSTTCQL